MARKVEIYCPKCNFYPRDSDRWMCECGNVWNTFDTNGTCPECGKHWKDTQCLSCHKWSPHNEWYHETNTDDISSEKELEKPVSR